MHNNAKCQSFKKRLTKRILENFLSKILWSPEQWLRKILTLAIFDGWKIRFAFKWHSDVLHNHSKCQSFTKRLTKRLLYNFLSIIFWSPKQWLRKILILWFFDGWKIRFPLKWHIYALHNHWKCLSFTKRLTKRLFVEFFINDILEPSIMIAQDSDFSNFRWLNN